MWSTAERMNQGSFFRGPYDKGLLSRQYSFLGVYWGIPIYGNYQVARLKQVRRLDSSMHGTPQRF